MALFRIDYSPSTRQLEFGLDAAIGLAFALLVAAFPLWRFRSWFALTRSLEI